MKPTLFLGATNQHEGKTTCSLGILAGLFGRVKNPGFFKPVGQNHLEVEPGVFADKDVPLFRDRFDLTDPYHLMSPVLFTRHFSRDYLNGKFQSGPILDTIRTAFDTLSEHHDFMLVEGTGHMGVGSICGIDNATIAALLGAKIVLVTSGGVGSCYDKLMLNLALTEKKGGKVGGVIINKVIPSKMEMVRDYMGRALKRLGIPLVGLLPYDQTLTLLTFEDLLTLFHRNPLSGGEYNSRIFKTIRLVATSREIFEQTIRKQELIITPATREDIILAALKAELKERLHGTSLETGFIFTGSVPLSPTMAKELENVAIPAFFTGENTFACMKKITAHTSKIRIKDRGKIEEAISLVRANIDFDLLLN
ncbi:MAG: hypothetical protein A3F09_03925 [Chlamydiae bacterium RIFCSPHIGHO2_12_FULL_49_11]|nr:MAG: hypothetical protein A3F09_03925 [Chlamydiae bacterium RIFCSPHIGHO2_12_FULL_49_11]